MSANKIIYALFISFFLFYLIGVISDPIFHSLINRFLISKKSDEISVKNTIKYYNKAYTDFYTSDGVKASLHNFPAITQIRHFIFRDIGFLQSLDRILIYDKADMKLISVKFPDRLSAEAIVFEEWNYQYQRRPDRMPVSALKGLGQGFKYFLRYENDQWIIYKVVPYDVDDPTEMS